MGLEIRGKLHCFGHRIRAEALEVYHSTMTFMPDIGPAIRRNLKGLTIYV